MYEMCLINTFDLTCTDLNTDFNTTIDMYDIIIIHVGSFIHIRADQLLVNMFVQAIAEIG